MKNADIIIKPALILSAVMAYLLWIEYSDHSLLLLHANDLTIRLISWAGIIVICVSFILLSILKKSFLNLYSCFLAFFVVFNFGQCILWAFDIHLEREIGRSVIFGCMINDKSSIVKAQLIFILSFIVLVCADALMYRRGPDREAMEQPRCIDNVNALYITAKLIALWSVPSTIYVGLRNVIAMRRYGYHSLVYGGVISSGFILNIGTILFFPTLVGLLIGSGYKKRIERFVYCVFAIYAVLSLFSGDRGDWMSRLLVLMWMKHYYNKRLSFKRLIIVGAVGAVSMHLIFAVISLRNYTMSLENIISVLRDSKNDPIVSMLAEFGNTMQINCILLSRDVEYPYGNSYLIALLTVFSTGIANGIYGTNIVQLQTWFSRSYLNINTGADFSMISETLLNFGTYASPFVMLVLGMIISWVAGKAESRRNPLRSVICIGCFAVILKSPRCTMWFVLSKCFYIILVFGAVYWVICSLQKKTFGSKDNYVNEENS